MTTIYLMDIISGSSPNCVEDERPTNWQSKRQRKGVQVLERWTRLTNFTTIKVPCSSGLSWHQPQKWGKQDPYDTSGVAFKFELSFCRQERFEPATHCFLKQDIQASTEKIPWNIMKYCMQSTNLILSLFIALHQGATDKNAEVLAQLAAPETVRDPWTSHCKTSTAMHLTLSQALKL